MNLKMELVQRLATGERVTRVLAPISELVAPVATLTSILSLGMDVVRLRRMGIGVIRFMANQRLQKFIKLAARSGVDAEEARLQFKYDPGRDTVRRDFRRIADDLDSASSDDLVLPMLQVLLLYSEAANRPDQEKLLALTTLIRHLHGADVAVLRKLIRTVLKRSNDDPILLWHDAKLAPGDEPGTLLGTGTSALKIERVANAPRIFRLLKAADLGGSVSIVDGTYEIDVALLPSDDNAIAIRRDHLHLLEHVFQ